MLTDIGPTNVQYNTHERHKWQTYCISKVTFETQLEQICVAVKFSVKVHQACITRLFAVKWLSKSSNGGVWRTQWSSSLTKYGSSEDESMCVVWSISPFCAMLSSDWEIRTFVIPKGWTESVERKL